MREPTRFDHEVADQWTGFDRYSIGTPPSG
jgi:hypothetical protein